MKLHNDKASSPYQFGTTASSGHVTGKPFPIYPGTFWYMGCGDGYYYSIDGHKYEVKRKEAYDMAKEEGFGQIRVLDNLPGSSGYGLKTYNL